MLTDGNQTSKGDQFVTYKNIESLCHIPETNIMLLSQLNINENNLKKRPEKEAIR